MKPDCFSRYAKLAPKEEMRALLADVKARGGNDAAKVSAVRAALTEAQSDLSEITQAIASVSPQQAPAAPRITPEEIREKELAAAAEERREAAQERRSAEQRGREAHEKLDAINADARARMLNADPAVLAARPKIEDWMTPEEKRRVEVLKADIVPATAAPTLSAAPSQEGVEVPAAAEPAFMRSVPPIAGKISSLGNNFHAETNSDGVETYLHTILYKDAPVGFVTLGWNNGKIEYLYSIKVKDELQGIGIGTDIIGAILNSNGGALKIMNIAKNARDFWTGIGTTINKGEINGQLTSENFNNKREVRGVGTDGGEVAGGGNKTPRSGEEPKSLLGKTPQKGTSVADITATLQPILTAWKNAPEVVFIQSMADAPKRIQDYNAALMKDGASGTPQAFFDNGKVYLVGDAINSTQAAITSLFHESLGHYGLRGAFGEALKPILGEIGIGRKADVDAKIKQYGLDPKSTPHRLIAAEEVLANLAEKHPELGIVKRAIAAVRNWLRSHGVNIEWSDNDIVQAFILPARRFVESGATGKVSGATSFSRSLSNRLRKDGEEISSPMDAKRRLSAGERIFAFHELDERYHEIKNVSEIDGYTADQMLALPSSDTAFSRTPEWVSSQPADTQEALRKAGIWHQQPTLKDRVKDWSKDWQQRVKQGMVDQFDPIKNYDFKAYMLARMSKSSDAALEGVLMNGTVFLDKDGAVDVNYEKGGFLGIMSKLQNEHDRFLAWVVGNRAERLLAEGKEHNFTAADVARLKALNQGTMPDNKSRPLLYEAALNGLRRYNKSVMDMAEQAGLIDPDSRSVWEKDFYVPFYRMMEMDRTKGPTIAKGLVRQYAFKTLKGGSEVIGDPMENILKNWSHLIDASLKNQAAKESVLAAESAGVALEAPEEAARHMAKTIGKKDAVIHFMDKGTPRYFIIDDPFLLDALQSIGFSGFQGVGMKAMQKFKHWLTLGVTISPTFRIRNIIRDSLTMIGTNPASYNVLNNIATGWKMAREGDPYYASIIAGGGVMRYGTHLEGDRAEHVKRLIEAGVEDNTILNTPEKVKAMLQQAWDWWAHIGDRSENVNRVALYKTLRDQGKSHLEASYAARDTMDFSMQGTWAAIRFLAQTVPFFNARLQGLYKLGRGAYADPQRFAYVVGAAAMASIALLMAYRDDDDWKRREDFDRESYWWFKIGDKAFRIPKPFEIGAIGTLAERAVEVMISDELTGKQFLERMGSVVTQQLSMNPIPQLVKPIIETWANKDFFTDRPIESMGMEKLSTAQRIGPNTSGVARVLGKAGLVSPVQIDHLINAYFGWLGTHIVMTADLGVKPAIGAPEKAAGRVDEMFVVGDFIKDLPAHESRYITHLYDQAKRVQESMADYRQALETKDAARAKEILQDQADRLKLAKLYTSAASHLSEINRQIKTVQNGQESPDVKRDRLEKLYVIRSAMAKATEERSRQFQK